VQGRVDRPRRRTPKPIRSITCATTTHALVPRPRRTSDTFESAGWRFQRREPHAGRCTLDRRHGRPDPGPVEHLYDRSSGKVTKLFATSDRPSPAPRCNPCTRSRSAPRRPHDGPYLTLPARQRRQRDGRPDHPVPLPERHGGPWARDAFGFDPEHQWLANRGYAVLAVTSEPPRASARPSSTQATASEDARRPARHRRLGGARGRSSEPDKVAIYGGSLGGYATLVGLTFTPERFACGVDIVVPTNLNTLLASIPPYWKSFFETSRAGVGDREEEGRALLKDRSPLWRADRSAGRC